MAILACNLESGTIKPSRQGDATIKPDGGISQETIAVPQPTATVLPISATDTLAAPTIEPSPTDVTPYTEQETLKYEPPKQYFCDANACWRTDGRLLGTSEYFFPNADETDAEIQALLADMGVPTTPVTNEKEQWERVVMVWGWLANHTKDTSSQEGKAGMQFLTSLSTQASKHLWPSIADWAKVYARFQFIPWEGCNYKAFFFAIVLYRFGLSPDQLAVGETYWNPEHNGQHLYGMIRQSGHWHYVDPTCVSLAALPPSPDSVGCLAADYQHPFGLAVLPGSTLTKPMLLFAPAP